MQRVEAGGKLVDRAGHSMNEIVASVTYVAGFMDDITTASQEQRAGIELVNRAIEKIDNMTQQNAALVEQAAAAAESLQEQTIELGRAVSVFKLNDDAAAVQVRPAAPAEPQVAPHKSRLIGLATPISKYIED